MQDISYKKERYFWPF